MKKLIALLLAMALVLSLAACSNNTAEPTTPGTTAGTEAPATEPAAEATYTYKDSVSTLATNWNPHTYQTNDDGYPADFLRGALYSFVFNDELHPVEGFDPFTTYVAVPEMAADMPVDVTEQVKAEHPEFGIPESATEGYAYTIALNPDCTWEDGTPINADTYVESMKRLLDPKLINYRAADYYSGSLCIAGAELYSKSGRTTYDDAKSAYKMEDLTKGEDGQYVNADGNKMFIGVDVALDWTSGSSLKFYVDNYGENYFNLENWDALVGLMSKDGVVPLTDENVALLASVIATEAWGETEEDVINYFTVAKSWNEVGFETVGLYKNDEYSITLVLGKALTGFNLYYNLGSSWLVKPDLYDACLTETDGVWTTTYNTSVETTSSFGPYKLVSYQSGKAMRFERNENWYGYTDGKHTYVDPTDGETYSMYMTTAIDCQVVAEAATNKMMFLKGELMTYGLQADDFEAYRNSEFCHATPSDTIFFLMLNGAMGAIREREAAADFDKTTKDLETMSLTSFHRAVGLTFDKELFAATVSPARSGGFGLIDNTYVCDPETGLTYRGTDQGKKVLCDVYGVDVDSFASLDEAVASITGYNPDVAKEFYKQAFDEALEKGYITDTDGDGISDQTVTIGYALSADSDFMTKTIDYLNEQLAAVTKDTPFDGKVVIVKDGPFGNEWSNKLKAGQSDTQLCGWTGSRMDPYGLTDLYVNPDQAYDAKWFDATEHELTLTVPVDGVDTELTMNLKQWSDALNGTMVTVDGKDYNFGYGLADMETRLTILAGFEGAILTAYNYLPMLQDGGMSLLSQQAYYVTDEWNCLMVRGGIQYMKYNYNDAEWAEYVASQGGELKY